MNKVIIFIYKIDNHLMKLPQGLSALIYKTLEKNSSHITNNVNLINPGVFSNVFSNAILHKTINQYKQLAYGNLTCFDLWPHTGESALLSFYHFSPSRKFLFRDFFLHLYFMCFHTEYILHSYKFWRHSCLSAPNKLKPEKEALSL